MDIVSVDIEDMTRVTGPGGTFNIVGQVTLIVADPASGGRPLRLRASVDAPAPPQATLQELELALLDRAVRLLQGLSLEPDAAEHLHAAYLARIAALAI